MVYDRLPDLILTRLRNRPSSIGALTRHPLLHEYDTDRIISEINRLHSEARIRVSHHWGGHDIYELVTVC